MTQNDLAERMCSGTFTLLTDGSNDDTSKQFPMVIHATHLDDSYL